jgi:hypothetical protein
MRGGASSCGLPQRQLEFFASGPSLRPCRDRLLWLLVELARQVAAAIEDAIGGGRAGCRAPEPLGEAVNLLQLIFCSVA